MNDATQRGSAGMSIIVSVNIDPFAECKAILQQQVRLFCQTSAENNGNLNGNCVGRRRGQTTRRRCREAKGYSARYTALVTVSLSVSCGTYSETVRA